MIKVLILIAGFTQNGITHCVLNYLENMKCSDIQFDLGVGGNYDINLINRIKKLCNSITFLPHRKQYPTKYFFDLKRLVRHNHYDIVHVNGNSPTMVLDLLAAKLGGCKIRIAHTHNVDLNLKINKFVYPIFNKLYTSGFACSDLAGKKLFKDKEFNVIENGIDIEDNRFNVTKRNKIRNKLNISDNEIIIGHMGVFNSQKNHDFLISIFNEITKKDKSNKYKLLLVGAGDLKNAISKKVNDLNLQSRVIFYGTTDDTNALMSAMDIFVFPSKFEGLGMVMIEAQVSGLPCFASDAVPKVTEITDNCRYISLNKSPEIWADLIIKCNYKIDRNNVNFKNIDRFDIKVQAEKIDKIYRFLYEAKYDE